MVALSLITIVVMFGLAYIWLTRGFFSALLHLTCTIIAGAIAFAAWEPLSYWLLDSSPTGGFMSFMGGAAWGVGLLVPFAISLALLRLIVDKLLPANVVLDQKLDYVGGGICGIGAGAITAGLLAISLNYFRMGNDTPSQPITYGSGGSLVRTSHLWIPVDTLTANLYGSLSERAFRTGEPLAHWHPDLAEEGATMRLSCFDGRGRNTTRTSDFAVQSRFTVGDGGKAPLKELLQDRWNPGAAQRVVDLDGKSFPESSHIEGFVVNFKAGAKEKDGKVAVGAGQVRLILENNDEERMTVFPVAVSSQAEADKPTPARWRYDAGDTYIASIGGAAESLFAFEFVCPPGYRPIALYVKGVRHDVEDPKTKNAKYKFNGAADRDQAIATGFGLISAASGKSGGTNLASGAVDDSESVKLTRQQPQGSSGSALPPPEGMRITEMLPFVIQKGQHGNLELDEENNKNIIKTGDATVGLEVLQNRGLEKPIQIQRLLTTPDTIIVQVDVSQSSKMSILGKSANSDENPPPALFDTNGTKYEPVGYIYQDETKIVVSFKPGEPVTSMSQLPTLSRSRPAQKLTLIFRCSRNVNLKYFGLGNKAMATFDPPILLDQIQGRN
jgi:hypothetical protein